MISEEKRLEEEAEKAALKHARLKLRRDLQQEAWVLGSPSPLTFPSSPSFNDLILDTIPISSRNTTLAPKIYESNTAVDKGKKMNDGEDSTSTVSGEQKPSRRGTKKEFKPIPCQRKPSRRDTTKSLKLKDVQSQEENRRRSLLEEKRKQHVVPFTDTRLRQNFWVLAFTNIARLRYFNSFISLYPDPEL